MLYKLNRKVTENGKIITMHKVSTYYMQIVMYDI